MRVVMGLRRIGLRNIRAEESLAVPSRSDNCEGGIFLMENIA
jgi:hypothetical protein